jgi:hypothetical protein
MKEPKDTVVAYEAPVVVVLGPVQELTRGDGGSISDGSLHRNASSTPL